MSIALVLVLLALIFFGLATLAVAGHPRFGWIGAGLFCWCLSTVIGGVHLHALAAHHVLTASVYGAAASGLDAAGFIALLTVALDIVSPVILKWAPADWKGEKMALIAIGLSLVLGVAQLYVTGQFDHFAWTTAAFTLGAFVGVQQGLYSLLKDRWHLSDPPASAIPVSGIKPPA
jgi:hypothetical protein